MSLVTSLQRHCAFHPLCIFTPLSPSTREDVPVMSVGLSITVVFPSAFVALSQGALRELSAPARLRVASAGAFHNLLLYLLFSVLARAPLLSVLGYRDVSAWGRVVSRIQPVSIFSLLASSARLTPPDVRRDRRSRGISRLGRSLPR